MKIFLFFFIPLFFISAVGCVVKRKSKTPFANSSSPYVAEEKPAPKSKPGDPVTIREERVNPVDRKSQEAPYQYYVIIGSFKVLDNARTYSSELRKAPFTPDILENESGLYRVSVGAYNDEEAARTQIQKIRTSYRQYSDVWLLKRKF